MKKLVFLLALLPLSASAGFFEYSLGISYNKSNYDRGSYSWNRKYGTSLGYNFNDSSSIEANYQLSYDRTHYEGYEDSAYEDQVFSLNWVQNFLPKGSVIQPYAKGGLGQLNRKATITLATGQSQTSQVDSVTIVGGVGIRIYLTKAFALRFEGTSYLVGGRLRTWNQNFGITAGGSLFF